MPKTKSVVRPQRVPDTRPYILTHPALSLSARPLAKLLGLKKSFEPLSYAPVIRWGNSAGEYRIDNAKNDPALIRICSNKLRFSDTMETLGIPHVEISSGTPNRFPVVIRSNLYGSRGDGIVIVENIGQFFGNGVVTDRIYWSYWRNFSSEFGVHIFDGKIIKVFRKLREDDSPEERFPIRNSARGYKFSLVDIEKNPKKLLAEITQMFMERFGLTFGRIDIGWNSDSKIYEIIEANTAPSLAENENTLELYASNFKTFLSL